MPPTWARRVALSAFWNPSSESICLVFFVPQVFFLNNWTVYGKQTLPEIRQLIIPVCAVNQNRYFLIFAAPYLFPKWFIYAKPSLQNKRQLLQSVLGWLNCTLFPGVHSSESGTADCVVFTLGMFFRDSAILCSLASRHSLRWIGLCQLLALVISLMLGLNNNPAMLP